MNVNPPATGFHNVSVNSKIRLDGLLGLQRAQPITFTFYIDNLFNEKYHYPEFNRKIINTIPASPGRMLFGEIAIRF